VASAHYWEAGIRHALEDHQFIGEYIPIVSLAFWTKLSPDLQQLLTGIWQENVSAYRANMAAAQAHARETIQEHGFAIAVPAPEEFDATRQKMIAEQDHIVKQSKISAEMLSAVSTVLAGAG